MCHSLLNNIKNLHLKTIFNIPMVLIAPPSYTIAYCFNFHSSKNVGWMGELVVQRTIRTTLALGSFHSLSDRFTRRAASASSKTRHRKFRGSREISQNPSSTPRPSPDGRSRTREIGRRRLNELLPVYMTRLGTRSIEHRPDGLPERNTTRCPCPQRSSSSGIVVDVVSGTDNEGEIYIPKPATIIVLLGKGDGMEGSSQKLGLLTQAF